jgi:transcription antitermination factor NusG
MAKSPSWFVLCTKPRYERKIVQDIQYLEHVEGYLPLQNVKRQWSDRAKIVQQPIFSNYVFVKTTNEQRAVLFSINGVLKFLCLEGVPVTLKESEIDRLRLLEKTGVDFQKESYWSPGQEVVIEKGVFAGLKGVLIRKTSHARLMVRLPLLQQAVSIQISETDVKAVR